MSNETESNVKKLVGLIPDNAVATTAFLRGEGFSYSSLSGYKSRSWLDEFGHGAYCRHKHNPSIFAGLDAAFHQLGLDVRIGGRSALSRKGFLHFIPFGNSKTSLYINRGQRLPAWFVSQYGGKYTLSATMILPPNLGITTITEGSFRFLQSDPERAILELLEQVPKNIQLNECYQILEMMTTLRPSLLQSLLEGCTSVKVKRLFLLLSEDLKHAWFDNLNLTRISLGAGCRIINKGGSFVAKYNLVVNPWREI